MPDGKIKKSGLQSLLPGLRAVWEHLAVYRIDLIKVTLVGMLLAIAEGLTPYIGGRLLDAIITPHKVSVMGSLIYLHIIFLVLWASAQAFMHISSSYNSRKSKAIGLRALSDYYALAFSNLMFLPMHFHKSRKLGHITDKIQRAGNELSDISGSVISDIGPQLLTFIVALGITMYINITLATVLLAGVLLYTVIMFFLVRPISDLTKARNKSWRKAWHLSYEALGNVQAVKQATTEEYEQGRLTRQFTVHGFNAWIKIYRLWQNLGLIQRSIILVVQVIIYVYTISQILAGNMTVGQLLMFNGYAAMMFGPFVTLGRNWQTFQSGLVSIGQAEKMLQHPHEKYNRGAQGTQKEFEGIVELRNVSFKYPSGKGVLNDISFVAPKGSITALVGESGVGKSTLIDLISGYFAPTGGRVLIDNLDVKKHDLYRLRSNIAVVSQEIVLFDDTIFNNIRYGNTKATKQAIERAAELAQVTTFVQKFPNKWKQLVGERGIRLSVGQKQRVAIARAILRNPKILILDEPTSALDAKSEHAINESLIELMRGRTTFIIAHRLSTVRHADNILVLYEGRIVEQGKHAELADREGGVYRKLYELQIGLHN